MGKTLIQLGVKFALILFSLGLLANATIWLQKKSLQSVKAGLIQIHPINNALVNRNENQSK